MKLAYLVTYEAYRLGAIRKQSKLYQSESQIVDGDSFIAMQDSISRNAVSTGEADSIDGVVITGASLLNPIAIEATEAATEKRDSEQLVSESGGETEESALLRRVFNIAGGIPKHVQSFTDEAKIDLIRKEIALPVDGNEFNHQPEYVEKLEAAFVATRHALSNLSDEMVDHMSVKRTDKIDNVLDEHRLVYDICINKE